MDKFNCQQCGACCKNVAGIVMILPSFHAIFKPDETGRCQHLREREDGKFECVIYEDRPLICNVDYMMKSRSGMLNISKSDYLKLIDDCCDKLRIIEKGRVR